MQMRSACALPNYPKLSQAFGPEIKATTVELKATKALKWVAFSQQLSRGFLNLLLRV